MSANTKNLRELSVMTLESGRITSELLAIAADRLEVQAAKIGRLREALQKVRPLIAADRQGLVDCHSINGKIPAEDELGTYGLYEYDGALHVIDAALSGEPT